MKKLLFSLIAIAAGYANAAVISQSLTNGVQLVSTNRAQIYNIQLINSAASAASVKFYDARSMTYSATTPTAYSNRVVVPAHIQVSQTNSTTYTNYVGYNGYTNWYTNVGVYTYTNAVAQSTNAAVPTLELSVPGSSAISYNVDVTHALGVIAETTTNVSAVIMYRP